MHIMTNHLFKYDMSTSMLLHVRYKKGKENEVALPL